MNQNDCNHTSKHPMCKAEDETQTKEKEFSLKMKVKLMRINKFYGQSVILIRKIEWCLDGKEAEDNTQMMIRCDDLFLG